MQKLMMAVVILVAFSLQGHAKVARVQETDFGQLTTGEMVKLYTLTNRHGASVAITNLGATITSMIFPDRDGKMSDLVLGFDSAQEYFDHSSYFGAIVGRYGNRIAGGKFSLDGIDCQ